MVATRGEDSRRIGRGERARPGKYDKTGRRATSQDGCMTLATIDSVVEPAVELAHRWAQATTQSTTASESRRSEEHTSELQSRFDLVCRLLLEKKNTTQIKNAH